MTEEKLNELKNEEGKIPELANQLIMTDDDIEDQFTIVMRWY